MLARLVLCISVKGVRRVVFQDIRYLLHMVSIEDRRKISVP